MSSKSIISDKSLEIVRATALVVKENATKITTCFYRHMLEENPPLFQFFNESNQRSERQAGAFSGFINGENSAKIKTSQTSLQSKTLADAVVAYALNIDKLENLTEAVVRIANKHCALGVKAEHYQLVHDYLMAAIGEVLGAAVTPEVAAAWSEAVMALAKLFIQVEGDLYKETEKNQWSGIREFTIDKIISETPQVSSIQMKPKDNKGTCSFVPGQYITVYEKPADKEYFAPRHYTLTSQPGDDYYQVTVKKLVDPTMPQDNHSHDGIMSSFLHAKREGDTVKLGPVFGSNLLEAGNKGHMAVFLSVGVGITPTIGVLPKALEQRPGVAVFHGDMSPSTFPFRKYLEETFSSNKDPSSKSFLSVSYTHSEGAADEGAYYSKDRLSVSKIMYELKKRDVDCVNGVDYYICAGPTTTPLLVKDLTKHGVEEKNLHLQYFGPFLAGTADDEE